MRKNRFCMVCLALILAVVLSIFPAFAVYEVDPDTEVLDQQPEIYYTENYYPGMFADGRSHYALASYGSYAAYRWNPILMYSYSVASATASKNISFSTIAPTVNVSTKHVAGEYVASANETQALTSASLILNLNNSYFDFQSSDFSFDQDSAQANTFYLNGTFKFILTSLWEIFTTSTSNCYAAVDPVGVQLLVDGKAYGDVIPITSYTSPFSAAFSSKAPATATVTFDNYKVYVPAATPELVGFRIYVDSSYKNNAYSISLGSATDVLVTNTNFLSWTTQPAIEFVRESTSSDSDLSNLGQLLQGGLFNGNGIPFLDVVSSLLADITDGFFDSSGTSWLDLLYSRIGTLFTVSSGSEYLGSDGFVNTTSDGLFYSTLIRRGLLGLRTILVNQLGVPANSQFLDSDGSLTTYSSTTLYFSSLVRRGLVGLRSLMVDSSGNSYLASIYSRLGISAGTTFLTPSGDISSVTTVPNSISVVLNDGLKGLSANIKSLRSYFADSAFSWQNYNLDTHELDPAQTVTGQNQFMNTAFQSIEENLGRLAYVFASDDELDLRDQADPGVASFKDAFGGGAKAKDIGQMKNTFDDVETMFDTGFSVNDFFDSLGSDDSWLSWFSAETAYALDSTPAVMTVGDEDPYNHQAYQDHLAAVEAIRNRGGASE